MPRKLQGVVVSDRMDKTVIVTVERLKEHPLYHKKYKASQRLAAHDETGAKPGDRVEIAETRPLSARKRWIVIQSSEARDQKSEKLKTNNSKLEADEKAKS